jgi:hypothetical protein
MNATIASTGAEVLRLRKWPAVWITIGAWLGLTVLFGYLFNYISYRTGDSSFSNEGVSSDSLLAEVLPGNVPHVLIDGMPMFGGALMMVLGALVAGSGYSWGTWKTVFTQGPGRLSVVTGSFAALTIFVVATVLASLALCFGLSLLVAGVESQTVVWPSLSDLARSTGAGFLVIQRSRSGSAWSGRWSSRTSCAASVSCWVRSRRSPRSCPARVAGRSWARSWAPAVRTRRRA